jgi:hypothetical protein
MRRGKRLKPRSEKAAAGHETLRDARMEVRARSGGLCELRIPGQCREFASEAHHVRNRSQGGGHTADNLLDTCRGCHDYVTTHPALARQLGYTEGLK